MALLTDSLLEKEAGKDCFKEAGLYSNKCCKHGGGGEEAERNIRDWRHFFYERHDAKRQGSKLGITGEIVGKKRGRLLLRKKKTPN